MKNMNGTELPQHALKVGPPSCTLLVAVSSAVLQSTTVFDAAFSFCFPVLFPAEPIAHPPSSCSASFPSSRNPPQLFLLMFRSAQRFRFRFHVQNYRHRNTPLFAVACLTQTCRHTPPCFPTAFPSASLRRCSCSRLRSYVQRLSAMSRSISGASLPIFHQNKTACDHPPILPLPPQPEPRFRFFTFSPPSASANTVLITPVSYHLSPPHV